jgi:hypothetical protein
VARLGSASCGRHVKQPRGHHSKQPCPFRRVLAYRIRRKLAPGTLSDFPHVDDVASRLTGMDRPLAIIDCKVVHADWKSPLRSRGACLCSSTLPHWARRQRGATEISWLGLRRALRPAMVLELALTYRATLSSNRRRPGSSSKLEQWIAP